MSKRIFGRKQGFTMIYNPLYTEPLGTKKPTFSTESSIVGLQRHQGQHITMLCQAQAFPVPLIR